jgi:hypothetical protein
MYRKSVKKQSKDPNFYLGLLLFASLTGCKMPDLPEYWACRGQSKQFIEFQNEKSSELYEGRSFMLLEVHDDHVSQYLSRAFSGIYLICTNDPQTLNFQVGNCSDMSNNPEEHRLSGNLIKESGQLRFIEVQTTAQWKMHNLGVYQCNYLGHQYPASVFYE